MKILKCKSCGVELRGRFFKAPSGVFCSECWENWPKEERDEAVSELLKAKANIGKYFSS